MLSYGGLGPRESEAGLLPGSTLSTIFQLRGRGLRVLRSSTSEPSSHPCRGFPFSQVVSLVCPCCFWKQPFRLLTGKIRRRWVVCLCVCVYVFSEERSGGGGWCVCVCSHGNDENVGGVCILRGMIRRRRVVCVCVCSHGNDQEKASGVCVCVFSQE